MFVCVLLLNVKSLPHPKNTATSITGSVYQTAAAAQTFATQKATEAVEFGKGVVVGAGATVQKYTPDPVMSLLNNAMTSAQALRTDPVATVNAAVKPYVPSFVVQVYLNDYK